jgi:fatty-acyl-CoA synthase
LTSPDTPSSPPGTRSDRAAAPDFRSAAWKSGVPRSPEELLPIHPTLLHALASAARLGERVGITLIGDDASAPEEHRSFAKIYGEMKRAAGALLAAGVRRGDRVLVILPTSFEFVSTFFAIQRIGAIAVPSYPPAVLDKVETALERIEHIANHCEATVCVTSSSLLPLLGNLGLSVPSLRAILAAEKLLKGPLRALPPAPPGPESAAFIQYTSGSTGNPKGVVLTNRNVVSNIHAIGQAFEVSRRDVVVSWLPLYHDMGLIGGLLTAIYWRMPLALMSPVAFLMRPSRWLKAIHDHRGTLSPAPNFAYALCVKRVRAKDREGLDLSSWRVALNGAEPVNHKIILDFERIFAPHGFNAEAMYPVYGLAESSLAVTCPRPGDPPRVVMAERATLGAGSRIRFTEDAGAAALVCVGRALPGHEVSIADDRGKAVSDCRVGNVLARGPSVMHGYHEDEAATSRAIRDGWLWTGDLGFVHEGGLYITGRAKDLIIVRGKNHYAEDIERVAETVEGVRPGGSVAFAIYDEVRATDRAIIVCETMVEEGKEREAMTEAIIDAVSRDCGLVLDEAVPVRPGTLPKTSSGKRQRSLTRDLYVSKQLTTRRTGRLKLALVVARSGIGLMALLRKRFRGKLPGG